MDVRGGVHVNFGGDWLSFSDFKPRWAFFFFFLTGSFGVFGCAWRKKHHEMKPNPNQNNKNGPRQNRLSYANLINLDSRWAQQVREAKKTRNHSKILLLHCWNSEPLFLYRSASTWACQWFMCGECLNASVVTRSSVRDAGVEPLISAPSHQD